MNTAAVTTDLPLDLFGITTPKGSVVHLVSEDETKPVTLCGKYHGLNPRYIGIDWTVRTVSPDRANCSRCIEIAQER